MYEIFLTDILADGLNPPRVAELLTVDSTAEANEFCITLQPFLREGIEAHFVGAEDEALGEGSAEQKWQDAVDAFHGEGAYALENQDI